MNIYFKVRASSVYLPERQVSSEEIDQMYGAKVGTTFSKNKIIKRHWANKEETTLFMAKKAIDKALEQSNLAMDDIDCIINAGCLVPQIIPCTASLLLAEYDTIQKDCFDIDCTCISFLKALEVASFMMIGGKYNRVLIFSSELASYGLTLENQETFPLFGDGAICFIVERADHKDATQNTFQLAYSLFQTIPDKGAYSQCKGGGTLTHPKHMEYDIKKFYFEMNGPKLYKIAYQYLPSLIENLFKSANINKEDVSYIVPHQASYQSIELLGKKIGLPHANLVNIITEFGNQVSVSLPHAFHHLLNTGTLQSNKKILLVGAAAGVILGGMILEG